MKANDMTGPDLDSLFAAAREDLPQPSEALMARILADAVAMLPQTVALPGATAARTARTGWFDWLAAPFGGGGPLAGVGLAMVAGIFIGVAQPEPVAVLTSVLLVAADAETVDLFPGDTALWEDQPDE